MQHDLIILSVTAASIGFFHTMFGPDHYLPFIMMSKAGKWSRIKTMWITFLCGLGHVGSSVLLGTVGVVLGVAVKKLEIFESFRGNLAAWVLIAFGLVYFAWGLRKVFKGKVHQHSHLHENGTMHVHNHMHKKEHIHIHEQSGNITPWVLFTIFVLGPCEPLIPILMYPAAKNSIFGLILVTGIFSAVTIATMMGFVFVLTLGLDFLPVKRVERYTHAIAGASIFLCGIGIQFLGL
jgi:sulfite exporter TauE/SafE